MKLHSLTVVKPLPKDLEKVLIDCYERERLHIEPVINCTYTITMELLQRGMISAKTFIKKRRVLFGFYVTQMGIDYLSHV